MVKNVGGIVMLTGDVGRKSRRHGRVERTGGRRQSGLKKEEKGKGSKLKWEEKRRADWDKSRREKVGGPWVGDSLAGRFLATIQPSPSHSHC